MKTINKKVTNSKIKLGVIATSILRLGEGEENLDAMLARTDAREYAAAVPAMGAGSSIPIDMLGIDENQAPNLANLSLKKIRKKALDRVEKEVISYVLDKTGWNRSKATKILKISYKTLLYKIKDLEIVPPPDAGE